MRREQRQVPTVLVGLVILLALTGLVGAEEHGKRRPDLDRLFFRQQGWIGGDGVFSVSLAKNRLLWLFGDTFVGRVENGRRAKVEMVNNTIGMQTRRPFTRNRVRYFLPRTATGKPEAFFRPPDHKGWFWPLHGIVTSRGLFIFLLQIERTDEQSALGFQAVGLWLARITNPQARPGNWFLSYRRVPWGLFTPQRNVYWGSAVLQKDGALYLYGIDEKPDVPGCPKKLVLARVAGDTPEAFGTWEFLGPAGWHRDFRSLRPLRDSLATEFSVTRAGRGYELVFSEAGLSRNILRSRADAPEGPWSAPRTVFRVDEDMQSPKAISYAGKAHPRLTEESRGLILSYVVNSLDFWEPLRHARMYWPRFVEVEP